MAARGVGDGKRRRGAAVPPAPRPAALPPAALNASLAAPAAVAAVRASFDAATPFRHAHVRDVFPDALLEAARDELLAGTYFRKRNDLYDFEQSDGGAHMPPGGATAAIRDAIYSPAFRAWITAVTGVETVATVDVSAAVYSAGSHLLCHDDDLACACGAGDVRVGRVGRGGRRCWQPLTSLDWGP